MIEFDNVRKDYGEGDFDISSCPADPFSLLAIWLERAVSEGVPDPNAMTLSTVSSDATPSSRIVLLKGLDQEGLRFFTNYNSLKGRDLEQNPKASALFFWSTLERQIRIMGNVSQLSSDESDRYFDSRPKDSQINAIISPQSETIPNRDFLLTKKSEFELAIENHHKIISRPKYWGGYILKPTSIEFWQGAPGRLNDRILYKLKHKTWLKSRLAP